MDDVVDSVAVEKTFVDRSHEVIVSGVGDLSILGSSILALTHLVYGFPFVLLVVSARWYTSDESLASAFD